jgi:thioesterase domain-containing protein
MPETTPPRTNLERELVLIWEQVLKRAPIGIRDDFFDLGGTSVHAARIFARIEEVIYQRLPLSLIIGAPTIEQLALSLLPGKTRDRKAYLLPVQSGGEKPIVFCIGGGHGWRVVSKYLGPDQPVFNIDVDPAAMEQMKGSRPMEKLTRHVVSAICEKQPQGPYYLCGYCQGGLFAYEAARQLIVYGHEVGLLALVETQNPSPHFKVRVMNGMKRNAMRFAFQVDQLYQLVRKGEISRYARARLLQMKRLTLRMSSIVSPNLQLRLRQLGRVDSQEILYIQSSFSKPKPLACPTAIFRCEDWPIMSGGDPYFGWREFLTGRVETLEIPGDHEVIFREPNVCVFAEKLRACLESARQPESRHYEVMLEDHRSLYSRESQA